MEHRKTIVEIGTLAVPVLCDQKMTNKDRNDQSPQIGAAMMVLLAVDQQYDPVDIVQPSLTYMYQARSHRAKR
jgi:hypothetical protein